MTLVLSLSCAWLLMALYTPTEASSFKLRLLSDPRAVCNDGTPAGFYISEGDPNVWVIYQQNGFWCWNEKSCNARWDYSESKSNHSHFMSSKNWNEATLNGEIWCQDGSDDCGIFSPSPDKNPDFWNATKVFIAYCSSDCHSGDTLSAEPATGVHRSSNGGIDLLTVISETVVVTDKQSSSLPRFVFRGRAIVEAVIRELVDNYQLTARNHANVLLVGGVSTLVNADFVQETITKFSKGNSAGVHSVNFRALMDGGFYGDVGVVRDCRSDVLTELECATATGSCSLPISVLIQEGVKYWRGQPDAGCLHAKGEFGAWRCYLGEYAMEHISSRLYVNIMQADAWQMAFNGVVINDVTDAHSMAYYSWFRNLTINSIENSIKTSRQHKVFAPNCNNRLVRASLIPVGTLVDSSLFWTVRINGQTTAQTLAHWFLRKPGDISHRLIDSCANVSCSVGCP